MARYYVTRTPLFALQPIRDADSRQVARRKVIVQRKATSRLWKKTGPTRATRGPTPAKPPRPRGHRWLSPTNRMLSL